MAVPGTCHQRRLRKPDSSEDRHGRRRRRDHRLAGLPQHQGQRLCPPRVRDGQPGLQVAGERPDAALRLHRPCQCRGRSGIPGDRGRWHRGCDRRLAGWSEPRHRARHLRPAHPRVGRGRSRVARERPGALHGARPAGRSGDRLGRRGRGDRHLDGRPQRRHRRRCLRAARPAQWRGRPEVAGQRSRTHHGARVAGPSQDRLGRLGRRDRDLARLPSQHE